MRTKLIPIGNSRGIRIPKALIEQLGLAGELDIFAQGCDLVLRPVGRHPRDGWAEEMAAMVAAGEDGLLDGWDFPNEFDAQEWSWPERQ